MGTAMPDPKILVDSVADGAVEVVEVVPRVAENCAIVCTAFAASMKGNMDSVKSHLPDNPGILPDIAVKAVGETVMAGVGLVQGLGKGIMDSLGGVQDQIRRGVG